jgi:capsular exopolysaccharide synthesis family protein
MDIHEYLWILRKRWKVVAVFLLLGVSVATGVSLAVAPQYAATAELFIAIRQSDNVADLYQGGSFLQQRVKSYAKVVTTSRVLQPVIDQLRLPETPESLAGRVAVESPTETVLIDITVRDLDPHRAADIANAIGGSVAHVVEALESPIANSGSPVRVSTVRQADPSFLPVSPHLPANVAIGALIGLILGLSTAVARNALDTRIHSERDVKQVTDAVIVGTVPLTPQAESPSRFIDIDQRDVFAEAFRRIRTNLQFVDVAGQVRSLAVTSAMQGEGKTTIAINLALALTHAGLRVVLVDADLRRPTVARYLDLVENVGLTTVLLGTAQLADVLQSWGGTSLRVLAAGECPPNPSELLGSSAMFELVGGLEERFDMVIVDTPPLLPVADAVVLGKRLTGCLVITAVRRTRRPELVRALESLAVVGARVLGLVFNRMPRDGVTDAHYGAGSYGYGYTDDRTTRKVARYQDSVGSTPPP